MKFTYTYLKNAESNNIKVGAYNGYPVYATSKNNLREVETPEKMFIIYDDNNYLYHNGKVFATIGSNGDVSEIKEFRYYGSAAKKSSPSEKSNVPAAETSPVEGDVMLGLLVDDVLKNARETTIDSLLVGFNYGL